MINKIFILLLTVFVIELCLMSFGQDKTFNISMLKSVYKIETEVPVKITSIITALVSICFMCFGLKYTSNWLWILLLASATFTSCLLGWKYVFGLHSEGTWGYSIFLSALFTIIAFFVGVAKADIYLEPVSNIPE